MTNMTKELMNEVQEKILNLEKLLMRDLDEREIDYLFNHSINDFLYDVLGFDKDDILVLMKIRKTISDWCTKPTGELTTSPNTSPSDLNLFFDNTEFEDNKEDMNFFTDSGCINNKVSDVLTSICNELQEAQRRAESKYVVHEGKNLPNAEITSECESADTNIEDELEDMQDVPDDTFDDTNESITIDDLVPDNAKKWAADLTIQDIIDAMNNTSDIITQSYLEKHPDLDIEAIGLENLDTDLSEDEITGELVDQIKNIAVLKYVKVLEDGNTLTLGDKEIESEVLDYLYKNNYKFEFTNNKISLV